MKVGDLIMRSKHQKVFRPGLIGVILRVHLRDPNVFSAERCRDHPVRKVLVLQDNGEIRTWYAIHTEVISGD